MINRALIALAGLAALSSTSLGTPTPKTIKCAVMPTESVNIANATKKHLFADYKGRRYYFCCESCPRMFKSTPAKFAKNPSIPIPKS